MLVCVCTVPPLKPHLCSSSYIQSISPVFVLYKSLMHKAYQILDMPPPLSLSCSPSFSSSLTPSLSWWVWLIGDTWDECETWELSRSSEHQPPCRVSIPYCTVKMKSREGKKDIKTEMKRKEELWECDLRTLLKAGGCVCSHRVLPEESPSKRTRISEYVLFTSGRLSAGARSCSNKLHVIAAFNIFTDVLCLTWILRGLKSASLLCNKSSSYCCGTDWWPYDEIYILYRPFCWVGM